MRDSTTVAYPKGSEDRASRHHAGERIGKYTLRRELGRGGMGEVWEVEGQAGEPLALKLMHSEDAGSEERRSRFMREARLLASVRHPHVVGIRDVFAHPGGLALVMDRLAGETLKRRLERGPLGASETMALVVQLLDALVAVHDKRIVHRDLKPDNLFLVSTQGASIDLRLLDFGIASADRVGTRTLTDLTQTGAILGTPAYMSPEQLFGETVDPRADLWSLGIIAYTCITGSCPTEDVALGGVIRRVTKDPIPTLRTHVQGPLADLVDAVLQKEREHRPPSAAACLSILQGRHSAEPRAKAAPRKASVAALAAALGIAALGVAALGTVGAREWRARVNATTADAPTITPAATTSIAAPAEAAPPAVTAASSAMTAAPALEPVTPPSSGPTRASVAQPRPTPKRRASGDPTAKPSSTPPRVEDIVLGQ